MGAGEAEVEEGQGKGSNRQQPPPFPLFVLDCWGGSAAAALCSAPGKPWAGSGALLMSPQGFQAAAKEVPCEQLSFALVTQL